MLNVNALNKTLSAMSLPQLQSYAAMHKNDPYVVSMALSIANTKKEALTAQQGMAGHQPMPKVVDQDIAQIVPQQHALPEESGIGQLPAPNIQGMAGGGIVAFEEGGEVPRFDGKTNGSQVKEDAVWDPVTNEWVNQGETPYSGLGSWFANKIGYGKGLTIDPRGGLATTVPGQSAASKQLNADRNAAMAQVNAVGRTQPAMQNDPRLAEGYTLPTGVTSDSVAITPTGSAEGTAGTGEKNQPPSSTGAVQNMGGAGLSGFMDFLKANKPAGPEDMDAYMKRRQDYLGTDPTKKQMDRLDKQEAQALADKAESQSMALLKAGLSMMSGTSPNAFENIGKGALAGVEEYALSQKDAKKMALERDKMRDAVENAAFAYKKGDFDAYEKYAQDAKNAQNTYAAHGLAALGSVTGAQIHAGATLGAANISSGATKEYLNAIRGGSLLETTRKDIAAQIQKAMPYATEAERTAAFDNEWRKALQANPILAKLSGSTAGGGGTGLSASDQALVDKFTKP